MGYVDQRAWADQFLPEIKQLIGPHLLEPAPIEEDCREATDLMVLRARDLRIACRVRKFKYLKDYANQFTLRYKARYGGKTEYDKVVEGWGDWMFYGFADRNEEFVLQWRLIDLSAFRAQLIRHRRGVLGGIKPNNDGTELAWFNVDSFAPSPPLIIAQSHVLPVGAVA